MTKNFDKLLKTCLNEMQAAVSDPSKDALLQQVVANKDHPELRQAIENALNKILKAQPKTPPQNQTQPQQTQPQQAQQKPIGQQTQQNQQQQPNQPNNNAANKPA